MRSALAAVAVVIVIALGLAGCGKSNPAAPAATPTATATPTPTATATPVARPNGPPILGIRTVPSLPNGTAPFLLEVNLCTCSDPDADKLEFELKWGDGLRQFKDSGCRFDHTYAAPGQYAAYFCVSDKINPSVCKNYLITVN
jgi:hypothetical protein